MVEYKNFDDVVIGDDLSLRVTVKKDGVVQDVGGSTSYFTIKSDLSQTDAEALSQTQGSVEGDGSSGVINFNSPASDTANANANNTYFYDIQVTLAGNRKYTLYTGQITFVPEVTKR